MFSCLALLGFLLAEPPDPVALYREGYALVEQGHYRQAERVLRSAWIATAEGDALRALLLHGLSIVQQETGNLQKAEDYARRSLELAPTADARASFTANLATLCAQRGRKQEAESLFRAGLAQSGHPSLHANYASFLVVEHRNLEALGEITRALDASPGETLDRARALLVAALCRYRLGDRKGSASVLAGARRLTVQQGGPRHPVLASALLLEWRLHLDAGRKREARTARALAESIRQESAQENLLGHAVDINALRR